MLSSSNSVVPAAGPPCPSPPLAQPAPPRRWPSPPFLASAGAGCHRGAVTVGRAALVASASGPRSHAVLPQCNGQL